jgi:hypothetical protein
MRKTIFIIAFASLYLLGCTNNNRKDFPQLTDVDAKRMYENYKKLIATDSRQVILQIAMSQKQLREFTGGSERVKLIGAAYDEPRGDIKTTIIIQIGTRKNDKPVYTYYDFREVFKPTIRGKEGEDGDNNTICPPPDNCNFPPLIKQ